MDTPNAIGWFDLYVTDLARATAFYEAVLQVTLQPMTDPTGETTMHAFPGNMTSYGAAGALVQAPYAAPGVGGTMIYFNVDDCGVAAARVAAAGGIVVRPKFSIGEFGWVALCQDTDGNLVGFNSRG